MPSAIEPSTLVTAVVVLYQRTAAESEAYASLGAILKSDAALAQHVRLLLYDNSPVPSAFHPAVGYPAHYVHNAANPGLAAAYNHALGHAEEHRNAWLLLLDQDTTMTVEFLRELLSQIGQQGHSNVAAMVPFLELDGRIYSPEADFFFHLRHQFPFTRNYPLARTAFGVRPGRINAYNSGAAIRVSALRAIGGFPPDFPLDYLDHAVFHLLQQRGYTIFVLSSVMQQKLSHINLDAVPLTRHRSVLDAQIRFVRRYGSRLDRLLYRLWLLRKSRHYRLLCSDRRVWKGMAYRALGPWPSRVLLP